MISQQMSSASIAGRLKDSSVGLRGARAGDDRPLGRSPGAGSAPRAHDTRDFVTSCRAFKVTPQVAQNQARAGGSALDARTVRHRGYAISQWVRKRVEETFGWIKTGGGLRRARYRGREGFRCTPTWWQPSTTLVRIANLSPAPA